MLIDIGADDREDAIKIGHSAWTTYCSHLSLYTDGKQEKDYGKSMGQSLWMWFGD